MANSGLVDLIVAIPRLTMRSEPLLIDSDIADLMVGHHYTNWEGQFVLGFITTNQSSTNNQLSETDGASTIRKKSESIKSSTTKPEKIMIANSRSTLVSGMHLPNVQE